MALEVITRQPGSNPRSTPLLFVHGAWHGAWCWDEYFLPYFAEKGYSSHALSLRGHAGSLSRKPMGFNTAGDYVADVAQVANQIAVNTGQRPVVIGHSMGGYIVQKYLERYTAPAAVLVASIPSIGTIPLQLRLLRHHTIDFVKSGLMLNAWPFVSTPEKAHHHFFSANMPLGEVKSYQAQMNGESLWILVDAGLINRPNPRKINPTPILVVAAEKDAVFTLDEERKTAQDYGTTVEIFPNMAHDMMLERDWQKVAARIAEWLDKQGI
jgi:pimeloyl-ACP methyl ester carboxylesterase